MLGDETVGLACGGAPQPTPSPSTRPASAAPPRRKPNKNPKTPAIGRIFLERGLLGKYRSAPLTADETKPPLVGVIMGSKSDWETMRHAVIALEELGVPHEVRVVSAHRTPDLLFWKLGERGAPDTRLAAVSFAFATNPGAVASDRALLARFRDTPGYPRAISVVIGRRAELPPDGLPKNEGVAVIFFDTEKWQASKQEVNHERAKERDSLDGT